MVQAARLRVDRRGTPRVDHAGARSSYEPTCPNIRDDRTPRPRRRHSSSMTKPSGRTHRGNPEPRQHRQRRSRNGDRQRRRSGRQEAGERRAYATVLRTRNDPGRRARHQGARTQQPRGHADRLLPARLLACNNGIPGGPGGPTGREPRPAAQIAEQPGGRAADQIAEQPGGRAAEPPGTPPRTQPRGPAPHAESRVRAHHACSEADQPRASWRPWRAGTLWFESGVLQQSMVGSVEKAGQSSRIAGLTDGRCSGRCKPPHGNGLQTAEV